ncbi:hypothetical protein [Methylobacterium sp. PvR107]|uniref:hypothetical protein n=1 Tax=Methylobacterium sp. PvR107 TaxID=2806597 RepID=UPI001AE94B21|nr:hypothetical protein [Methylobacterium sp. PvR107]MBP1182163.1 hypothetical protein [Methylobacterium sp. PvR107]
MKHIFLAAVLLAPNAALAISDNPNLNGRWAMKGQKCNTLDGWMEIRPGSFKRHEESCKVLKLGRDRTMPSRVFDMKVRCESEGEVSTENLYLEFTDRTDDIVMVGSNDRPKEAPAQYFRCR